MNKPNGYDEATVYGNFKKLFKGGYICKIVKLEEAKSQNGNDMIVVYLDIADGEFKDYYMQKFQSDTRPDKKWSCIYRQIVLDTTTHQTASGFKGFIAAVEESNSGFISSKIWGDDFTKYFKGKYIGCVFADKHWINNDGKEIIFAVPYYVCSVNTIKKGEFKIPKDIMPDNILQKSATDKNEAAFTELLDDDDLPF